MASDYRPGKDTRPLASSELAASEIQSLKKIERRIKEVQQVAKKARQDREGRPPLIYFAYADVRYQRVLLLDGDRGTGKTSLLVTLARRWNPPSSNEYDEKLGERPEFVRVLPILDFDPLPPGMPLAAGIVQAWRPLVNEYERIDRLSSDGCEASGETLLDRWHKLFRYAAVGWSQIPESTGLIEQALDREEQLGDWQRLDRQWYEFVEEVIKFGTRRAKGDAKLEPDPIFAILVDDVDLQVERARELLPAVRLLYHPSVVFVIAADREHLIDMLEVDFRGRQHRLATGGVAGVANAPRDADRWSRELALSAFEKVFAAADRIKLERVSVTEFLNFGAEADDQSPQMTTLLNSVQRNAKGDFRKQERANQKSSPPLQLGDYLRDFGEVARKASFELRLMTYRALQQLSDTMADASHEAIGSRENDPEARGSRKAVPKGENLGPVGPFLALQRILDPLDVGPSICEVRLRTPHSPSDRGGEGERFVEYRATGQLEAVFAPQWAYELMSQRQQLILSARPRFNYQPVHDPYVRNSRATPISDFVPPLVATELRDSGAPVAASGITWDVRLALVWTRWQAPGSNQRASFRWNVHVHPTPMQLFEWTSDWQKFMDDLSVDVTKVVDHIGYAWIWHLLKWSKPDMKLPDLTGVSSVPNKAEWDGLLKIVPPEPKPSPVKQSWKRLTLPLLARPELGLSDGVQRMILAHAQNDNETRELVKGERERMATEALIAAALERRETPPSGVEEEKQAKTLLASVDDAYAKAGFGGFREWISGKRRAPTRSPSTPRRTSKKET